MTCNLQPNGVISAMSYESKTGVLSLRFKKQTRYYNNVPIQLAYSIAYAKSGSEVLSIFSKKIKKQFKIINVCQTN
jgi:hypothetical protein